MNEFNEHFKRRNDPKLSGWDLLALKLDVLIFGGEM